MIVDKYFIYGKLIWTREELMKITPTYTLNEHQTREIALRLFW